MDPSLKLAVCVLIDIIGIASYAAPIAGEAADLGWAPISALLVNYLFGNGLITTVAFFEELLPGFDVIPTATIAWFLEYSAAGDAEKEVAERRELREDAIDVSVSDR
ncbi:hypothetical protein CTAYLR_002875 [Chrysophaeum taylorii]|uniref:Uncharacterized protein n=1 Tax=Chrysophaeum taylorii TaxID=2483200 RepID=A0AAD7U8B0_9STRA|nr:hypothetical protein CTAYLR_002875 [Chrysophaeum taylorii]